MNILEQIRHQKRSETLSDLTESLSGFAIDFDQLAFYLIHELEARDVPDESDKKHCGYHLYQLGKMQYERLLFVMDFLQTDRSNPDA